MRHHHHPHAGVPIDRHTHLADTLHLHKELCLDAPHRRRFALGTRGAERVNLVNEDDRWSRLASHFEQVAHEPVCAMAQRHTSDEWLLQQSACVWFLLYRSDSPCHCVTRSDEETEKKVEPRTSEATACARKDLPVPGGCTKDTQSQQVVSTRCLWCKPGVRHIPHTTECHSMACACR